MLRIGKVTKLYPEEGKIQVTYEDSASASMPLPMISNGEYNMPAIGERVVVAQMDGEGSSKGFVLGTYFNTENRPSATSGYRKDLTAGVYVECIGGACKVHATSIELDADKVTLGGQTVSDILKRIENLESREAREMRAKWL